VIGVVLLQLGTPDEPTPAAVRRYLREFLLDERVIDLNRAVWLPILYGAVLTRRPAQSAKLYRKVWTPEGSPLAVITRAQAEALESRLSEAVSHRVPVVVGMRYGNPSIASALDRLADAGVDRVLAFPMYPQYAGATTGSSLQKLFAEAGKRRVVPSLRVVPPYHADPHYIGALAALVRKDLVADRLLLSFHGLPKRYATEGDPYPEHCAVTTKLLTAALGSSAPPVDLIFQSRFGREEWLQPYLDVTLEELGRRKLSVAVMSPGFTADCLETIEEVGLRGAEQFTEAGGKSFHRIGCLNTSSEWIDAMAAIALRELGGWLQS
jgi:ferrochelatase